MTTNIVTAIVTAYCAGKCCCGPSAKGICANGQRPTQGITIAASRTIKFGSLVEVDGRRYIVQDRLAKRYDSRFDIYFEYHEKAKQFGIKRNQKVTVIIR